MCKFHNQPSKRVIIVFILLLVALLPGLLISDVQAQEKTKLNCGDIVTGFEFTKEGETHTYLLEMATGESFTANVVALVDYLTLGLYADSPTRPQIAAKGWDKELSISTGTLAKGTYTIRVANQGIGPYTLSIGCITQNGEIKPGEGPQPTPQPTPSSTPTPRPALPEIQTAFTGLGFPGLNPVDFADAITVSLNSGQPTKAAMALNNQILGFTLEVAAGDVLDLNYARLKGNMNWGIVVLSADNHVFFQASLVTSESLTTRFTVPAAGAYTIGIFRISLVEPTTVTKTEFQLTATLNPKK